MAAINIFRSNAFSTFSLTEGLEQLPYNPAFLGKIPNLFVPRPVRTKTVGIESRAGMLSIIATSERGAPLQQRTTEKREIRDVRTVRIAETDRLTADEIQDIRAFGSESELMGVQDEISRRLGGPVGLLQQIEYTKEYHRLGAVQGVVYDANGTSVIKNWFTEFGVTQDDEIDFDLDNASPASGAVRKLCNKVVRQVLDGLQMGAVMPGEITIVALCGNNFWDDLTAHPEVRQTYLNQIEAKELREGNAYGSFEYGGITWVNYRSSPDGKVGIGTDKVKFFPSLPGVFEVAYSPAETFEWVNTPGKEFYAMIVPDKDRNMFVNIEAYSYPLFICKRPKSLQRGKRT